MKFCLFFVLFVFPQEKDDSQPLENGYPRLEDMVITATRTEKDVFDVPAAVDVITEKEIRSRKLPRTLVQALKETPGVMVQKTSYGQGSPYIRGFTGFRTLMLIDGIRLNNSVFRSGPNQYWNTVDPLSMKRMEVVKGPSSVLYGSDAIGGVVNAITTSPERYGEGLLCNGRLHYRFASAEKAHIGRAEVSGSIDEKLGFIAGFSLKRFGELRGGRGTGRQQKTGYDEWDGDLKLEYLIDPSSRLVFAHQKADQNDVWRTHKTIFAESWEGTDVGNDRRRSFDQNRELTYLQYHRDNPGGPIKNIAASVSYQTHAEERLRIREPGKGRDRQGFDVGTLGIGFQMTVPDSIGEWTFGTEYYRDTVDSFSKKYDDNGAFIDSGIQGPVADDSTYDLLGVFAQDEIPLGDRLDLVLGTRYTFAAADVDSYEDPVTGQEESLTDKWSSLVGSARLLYNLDEDGTWNVYAGASQGFRAPNLSDLTRLDSSGTDWKEIPSPDLDPENYISYEAGLKARQNSWAAQLSYYYTDIRNMIVRTLTGDKLPDGEWEAVKKNAGDGYLHGIEVGGSMTVHPRLTAFSSFAWLYGAVRSYPSTTSSKAKEPLSRMMPAMGNVGLRWDDTDERFWAESTFTFAAKADKLSLRDKGDTQRIPPGGTPGYRVLTMRGGWNVGKNLTITAAVENITNEDYRVHGSGLNEPGRNLVLGVTCRF